MPKTEKSALTVQKPFPILRLPPEIRNGIWRYVVVKDEDVMVRHLGRKGFIEDLVPGEGVQGNKEDDDRRINSTPLALALTSRQLYLEVALIYYSENTFHFQNGCFPSIAVSMLEQFTSAIGPHNASSITSVRFNMIGCTFGQTLYVLPGLKQFVVNDPPYLLPSGYYNSNERSELRADARSHPSVVIKHLGKDWRLQD